MDKSENEWRMDEVMDGLVDACKEGWKTDASNAL